MYKTPLVLLLLSLVAVTANSSSPEPEPGLYRVTVDVHGQGLPSGMVQEAVEQCVTKEDLAADPTSLLGENAGMEGCTITKNEWGNGKIEMQMECSIEGTEATAISLGSYNASRYELKTVMTINFGDTSVEMETSVSAERIGDC